MPPPVWSSAWSSAVLSSARAVCLAADAGTLPSAGAPPAETLTAPGGEEEVKVRQEEPCIRKQSANFPSSLLYKCFKMLK